MSGYGETTFRLRNRRIRLLVARFDPGHDLRPVSFVCECADERCFAPVPISVAEFEAVCAGGEHRLIAPGHQAVGEYVVVETPLYAVVRLARDGEDGRSPAKPAAVDRRQLSEAAGRGSGA
jgi:hypothetical protein